MIAALLLRPSQIRLHRRAPSAGGFAMDDSNKAAMIVLAYSKKNTDNSTLHDETSNVTPQGAYPAR